MGWETGAWRKDRVRRTEWPRWRKKGLSAWALLINSYRFATDSLPGRTNPHQFSMSLSQYFPQDVKRNKPFQRLYV